jgi:hypothetical protein
MPRVLGKGGTFASADVPTRGASMRGGHLLPPPQRCRPGMSSYHLVVGRESAGADRQPHPVPRMTDVVDPGCLGHRPGGGVRSGCPVESGLITATGTGRPCRRGPGSSPVDPRWRAALFSCPLGARLDPTRHPRPTRRPCAACPMRIQWARVPCSGRDVTLEVIPLTSTEGRSLPTQMLMRRVRRITGPIRSNRTWASGLDPTPPARRLRWRPPPWRHAEADEAARPPALMGIGSYLRHRSRGSPPSGTRTPARPFGGRAGVFPDLPR